MRRALLLLLLLAPCAGAADLLDRVELRTKRVGRYDDGRPVYTTVASLSPARYFLAPAPQIVVLGGGGGGGSSTITATTTPTSGCVAGGILYSASNFVDCNGPTYAGGTVTLTNGVAAVSPLVVMDNATPVFTIADGGNITHAGTSITWPGNISFIDSGDSVTFLSHASGTGNTTLAAVTSTGDMTLTAGGGPRVYYEGAAKTVTDAVATTIFTMTLGNDTSGGGTVDFCVVASDSVTTTRQSTCGQINFSGSDVTAGAGGEVCAAAVTGTNSTAPSTGTLTVTASGTTGTDLCNILVTADTSFAAPTLLAIRYTVNLHGDATTVAITPQ